MKLIVGLGTPGRKYEGTPHNAGFDVVDELASRTCGAWRASRSDQAELAEVELAGQRLLLAKPVTFMNLSGQSVREIMRNRPITMDELLVVSDDISLDIGRLRIRGEGSHGGHNGLRSLIECLGGDRFARLRIGIRPGREYGDLAGYVLSRPRREEAERLKVMTGVCADAAECWVRDGTGPAGNKFNGHGVVKGA